MNRKRSGFSLIELLVVITILGIAIALLLPLLGVTGATARAAATKTTLEKLDSLLQAKLDALQKDFDEQDRKKTRADVVSAGAYKTNWFNLLGSASDPQFSARYPTLWGIPAAGIPMTARVGIIKNDRYRGMFPQRVRDLYGLNNVDDGATHFDDSPLLDYWKSTTPIWNDKPRSLSAHQPATESSELLYLALSFGKASGASVGVLGDINQRHIKDSDGDGVPEIYDDWGNMLRFYNAPTRLVRPNGVDSIPTATQYSVAEKLIAGLPARPTTPAQATDFGNSFNQNWMDKKNGTHAILLDATQTVRQAVPCTQFEALFLTPDTYWRPMIVSAGEDGDFGLGDPVAVGPERLAGPAIGDMTNVADNLTNLQR